MMTGGTNSGIMMMVLAATRHFRWQRVNATAVVVPTRAGDVSLDLVFPTNVPGATVEPSASTVRARDRGEIADRRHDRGAWAAPHGLRNAC